MNEILNLTLAFTAGVLLGGIFFWGLWWTVQKGLSSQQPALWVLASMLARTAIVLTGFHFVAQGRWERFLMCLAGFIIARFITIAFVRRADVSLETGHATHP